MSINHPVCVGPHLSPPPSGLSSDPSEFLEFLRMNCTLLSRILPILHPPNYPMDEQMGKGSSMNAALVHRTVIILHHDNFSVPQHGQQRASWDSGDKVVGTYSLAYYDCYGTVPGSEENPHFHPTPPAHVACPLNNWAAA